MVSNFDTICFQLAPYTVSRNESQNAILAVISWIHLNTYWHHIWSQEMTLFLKK